MNEKQHEILNAAERLFAIKGFDGTSVRDIAKEANVNVAMISYYFGSKEKLLETLFEVRLIDFKIDIDPILHENLSALESLEQLTYTYIRKMNVNAELYKILSVEGGIKKQLLRSDSYTNIKKLNLEMVTKVIEKGIAQGVFRKDSSAVLIHATMMGIFMNFQMNRAFLQDVIGIHTDEEFNHYVENQLTHHIHKTIKAVLIYED